VREKEKASRIIYVRHGETNFPIDRIYCDLQEDPPLSEKGLWQAEQTAEFLANVDAAAIYASPCCRTRMTAEAIAKNHKHLLIGIEPDLMERNFGIWEGLYFHEIESQYPDLHREWKQNQALFKPERGESVYDLADRTQPVIDRLLDKHAGQTIIVVAHVGPIRALIAKALEMPVEGYRRLGVDPASATCIDYGGSQNNLIFMNFHLRHYAKEQSLK
jgi:broad specificity phosphatase PhoE